MAEPQPAESAQQAFSGSDVAEARRALEEMVAERRGQSPSGLPATAPKPRGLRFGQIIEKLKGLKFPSMPKPHMPDLHMPNVSMPDLSGVGEAIDQNKVGRFLKGSAESSLLRAKPAKRFWT